VGTFVDESGEAGFIVFSMGSVLAEKDFPPHILSAFVEAFSKIPQRVIWKWNAASPSGVTPNVKLLKWLPQQDILGKFILCFVFNILNSIERRIH